MDQTDYLILIQSPDAATTLIDPIGPSPYNLVLENPADPTSGAARYFPNGTVPSWRNISLSPRGNTVGSGTFTCNATLDLLGALMTPEARAVVIREPDGQAGYIEMAGPVENVTLNQSADRDGTDGLGTVTVQFADDLASLATRLVYPNPAQASTGQTTTTKYTVATTNAEDAARALVNLNAAGGALTGRGFPELVLGPDHGVGTSISTSFVRSVILTDALRSVLLLGGNLGMRTYQTGNQVFFSVYQPQDLSATVWFSRALGNVKELTFEFAAPTATVAIVGDDTAGTARVVKERVNTAALADGWRRKEVFVDGRSAANATELEQAGDEALKDAGPTAKVSVVAIETALQRYRTDFNLLDTVSVEVFDGYVVTSQVAGVDITVTPERGEVITPLIGAAADNTSVDLKGAELVRLRRRVAQLEGAL